MQLECGGGGLDGGSLVAKILLRQFLAAKFLLATHFPQKISIDLCGQGFSRRQELLQRRFKTQHHGISLYLAALARDGFNL